ncbi:Glycoside hydrolase subgroup catalytic core [Macrophomina phaseolina MS6]|uniref:Glycoside hydrolase subgroup catalytic core n=1 Tax=Macrophomina phaseolina (strain MS6) TaxID=1126212 RepID=K2RGV6_MACPH|nr:Glycoside hydrolase subgroup catalytic core [Macrophomina phaseolina MS6]
MSPPGLLLSSGSSTPSAVSAPPPRLSFLQARSKPDPHNITIIRRISEVTPFFLSFSAAGDFHTLSGPYLSSVVDTDGTTTKLVFDVHQYLDEDRAGNSPECVRDGLDDGLKPLADWLRTHGRKA